MDNHATEADKWFEELCKSIDENIKLDNLLAATFDKNTALERRIQSLEAKLARLGHPIDGR